VLSAQMGKKGRGIRGRKPELLPIL
jgi:hypothetical protein